MKNFILAVMLFLTMLVTPAFSAVVVDTSGLSEAQKAALVQQIETINGSPDAIVEKVDKWVNAGERIGKMLGGAAKELGIAVNDFMNTPAGVLTVTLIIYQYIGNDLIHLVLGFSVFVVGFFQLRKLTNGMYPETFTYDKEKTDIFGRAKLLERKQRDTMSGDAATTLFVGYLVLTAVSAMVMFLGT